MMVSEKRPDASKSGSSPPKEAEARFWRTLDSLLVGPRMETVSAICAKADRAWPPACQECSKSGPFGLMGATDVLNFLTQQMHQATFGPSAGHRMEGPSRGCATIRKDSATTTWRDTAK